MITLLSAVGSLLSFRIRSRASLELEVVALRHQLTVLRRQRPGRPRLFSGDRMLWVWLYRIWPQVRRFDAEHRRGLQLPHSASPELLHGVQTAAADTVPFEQSRIVPRSVRRQTGFVAGWDFE